MGTRRRVMSGGGSGVLALSGGGSSPYQTRILTVSPIGYWRFNEAAGTGGTAADSSGNGHHGTHYYAHTAPIGAIAGDSDKCFESISGSFDFVSVPYNAAFDLVSQVTIEVWVHSAFTTDMGLVDKTLGGNTNQCYQLFTNFNTLTFRTNTSGGIDLSVSGALTANAWNHIVATFNAGVKKLYVNGVQVATVTVGSTILGTGSGPLLIGSLGNGLWQFQGKLDEVAVYGTALSAGDVMAHYQMGVATSIYRNLILSGGPLAYWPLGEPSGPTIADLTTGRYHATEIINGTASPTRGLIGPIASESGTATGFSNTTSVFRRATEPVLRPTTAISLSGWFKVMSSSHIGICVIHRDGGVAYGGPTIFHYLDAWQMWVSDGTAWTFMANAARTVGVWTHLAVTYGGGIAKAYKDGLLLSTAGPFTMAHSTAGVPGWHIGGDCSGGTSPLNQFQGHMAHVAIHNRELSGAEILSHYNAGI